MSRLTTFYIVRHGESEWNSKKLIQGQTPHIPLTNNGKNQAKKLGDKLKSIDFDKVFSSDLLRAKQTAEIITLDKKIVVATIKALRERNFGSYTGKPVTLYLSDLKKMIEKRSQLSNDLQMNFRIHKDIETDSEIVSRLILFLRETAVAYQGKKILIVAHGGLMSALLIHLGYYTYTEIKNSHGISNTSYIVVQSDGTDFFLTDTYGVDVKGRIIEIIDIVDEENNILYQASKKQAHEKGLLHRCVMAMLVDSKGRWLLVKPRSHKQDAGQYVAPVGGHIKAGESDVDALNREVAEEIGIKGFKHKLIGRKIFNRTVLDRKENHYLVLYEIYSDDKPVLGDEAESYRYFSQEELKALMQKSPKAFGGSFHFVIKNIMKI